MITPGIAASLTPTDLPRREARRATSARPNEAPSVGARTRRLHLPRFALPHLHLPRPHLPRH